MQHKDRCGSVTAVPRSRVHLFALATTSGRVYFNSYDGYLEKEDTLDSWRPVTKLSNVLEIIGAVPHETPKQQRLILLFVKVRQNSKNKLVFISFDLDINDEWSKSDELDLPPGTEFDFSAVAVQKRLGSVSGVGVGGAFGVASPGRSLNTKTVPTLLAIRAPNGRVYVRDLNSFATDWAGDGWMPLHGDVWAERTEKICALVQRSQHEYLMIVRDRNGWLYYRIFSVEPVISRDDGRWRSIASEEFAGAFAWPGTTDTYVFYLSEGTKYAVIENTAELVPQGFVIKSIQQLEIWLRDVVGVSLENYKLDFLLYFDLHKKGSGNKFGKEPLGGIYPSPYNGNLFDLLTLTTDTWEYSVPEEAFESKGSLLTVMQQYGLNQFLEAIKVLDVDFFRDPELGQWKLADWYVRQFANGKGFVAALEDALDNKATKFRYRGLITESEYVDKATSDQWHIIPSGGDEEFGQTPRKAVVLRMPNAAFRMKLKRSGDILSTPKLRRVTPDGNGPFDLAPLSDRNDLQTRRNEIKAFYVNLKGSPPSVLGYLKEAYNFLPIYLGYNLQRNGFYEESLLWYRQVYDYLQPDEGDNEQKIDYSLKLEETLKLNYEDAEDWLDDASNAHAIAATRKNTYTRYILLMIVRCLIDYADALFSHDNVTDNARARELYILALKLLDLNLLKPGKSRCKNIIDTLEIEVDEPGQLPFQQMRLALSQIQDIDQLESIVTTLKNVNQDTSRPTVERLFEMREMVVTALSEIPPLKSMAAILDSKRVTIQAVENQFMAHKPSRILLEKIHRRRRETKLRQLAEVTSTNEETLLNESLPLIWLRAARPANVINDVNQRRFDLAVLNPTVPRRLVALSQNRQALPWVHLTAYQQRSFAVNKGISFDFCIPRNPVVKALRTRAENNLMKLRTCRNIAGFLRQIDPYGAPIGIGSGMVSPDGTIFSGIVDAPPTPYRYLTLIARAKELINIAQQIEASYQTTLEKAENEALSVLQAEQNADLAKSQITLRDLGLTRANSELGLTQLQKNSAILREETYGGWINAGKNAHEVEMLKAYSDASEAQKWVARSQTAASLAQLSAQTAGAWSLSKAPDFITGIAASQTASLIAASLATIGASVSQEMAINAEARAQSASFNANFERRNDEWMLQKGLAALDVQIGDQQIQLAQDGIAIAQQERIIAGLAHTQAVDILTFLRNKDFTEEMYRWIAGILEDVYRFFLQEAASISRLAERQLAFERQQAPLKVIQNDYWNIPVEKTGSVLAASSENRLGLTGSARLLKDIYQLDNYAFETRRRKQALTITLDLAEMFPVEFQRFRETGVLVFETPVNLIHRQFPGYYLCLIQQVTVSVVALIPPNGIRASLTSAGTSRVIVGGDIFQTVTIRNLPERMALTAASTSSGVIELEPDAQSLSNPFEGSGFDTLWELRMPKASNPFNYNSMATVLFTVDMTALHSFDYEREVIESLDKTISLERAFDFRQVFADPWYDLNNPDQTDTPMTVRFETRRSDFPSNLTNLAIQHVVLYFVRKDGETFEQEIQHLRFTPEGTNGHVGGPSTTVDGRVSTRNGNGTNWLPMIGLPPIGQWELAFPDNPPSDTEARDRFSEEQIENLILVVSFSGKSPDWPS